MNEDDGSATPGLPVQSHCDPWPSRLVNDDSNIRCSLRALAKNPGCHSAAARGPRRGPRKFTTVELTCRLHVYRKIKGNEILLN